MTHLVPHRPSKQFHGTVSEFTVQVEHITVLGFRAEEQFTSLRQDCRCDDSQAVAVCNKEKMLVLFNVWEATKIADVHPGSTPSLTPNSVSGPTLQSMKGRVTSGGLPNEIPKANTHGKCLSKREGPC